MILPSSGNINHLLEDEDIVEFEITSMDIWVRVYIAISSGKIKHSASFELRVDRDMRIEDFQAYL
jgi:hypothetical protein